MRTRIGHCRWACCLVFFASVQMPGAQDAWADDEPTAQQLSAEVRKAYDAGDFKKALEGSEKLHKLAPDDPLPMYNIACMHARLADKAKAYEWLERAVDAGYSDHVYLLNDADFTTLWGEKRFRGIVENIRKRNPGRSEPTGKAADKKEPKAFDEKLPKVPALSPEEHGRKIGELTQELIKVSNAKERDKALDISLEALAHAKALEKAIGKRAANVVGLTHYNVACMTSLKKEIDRAFWHLNKAVDVKGWDPEELRTQMDGDSDLDPLRKDARFEKVMKKVDQQIKEATQDTDESDADAKPGDEKDQKPAAEDDKADKPADEKPDRPKRDLSAMSQDERVARFEELTSLLMKTAQAGDYKKALEHSLEAFEMVPNSLAEYNVACMYSLNKNADAAFRHLFNSLNAGGIRGDPVRQLKGDTDLNYLHDDPRWNDAIAKAQKLLDEKKALPKDKEVEFQHSVTLPPNHEKSKPAPLIVALHHFHGNMDATAERWKQAAADVGAVLLTPQGTLEAGEGSGSYQWGDDFAKIERNVMSAINNVMDEHAIDDERVVIVGFGQGAGAAVAVALRNPEAFRGAVLIGGVIPAEITSPASGASLASLRLCFIVGSEDNSQVVKANQAAAKMLQDKGAAVRVDLLAGQGPGFPENGEERQIESLRYVLKS
ncbi:MAG TPA: PHB depolymerase family esterase [Phycisphaerae bacterium]|nr:PHB depolymerase family esterase [Phycisphaerae bacterium]